MAFRDFKAELVALLEVVDSAVREGDHATAASGLRRISQIAANAAQLEQRREAAKEAYLTR